MFSDHPPTRRPWSPDPYDPLPSNSARNLQNYNYNSTYQIDSQPWQPRRDASDVSVEALDLADYSMTLRTRELSRYPPLNSPPLASQDYIQPSSLPSRVPTITSNAPSFPSLSQNSSRRPLSLPPPSVQSHASFPRRNRSPNYAETKQRSPESEIDISRFPVWSRNWYQSNPPDIYTPIPASQLNFPTNQPLFDPGYKQKEDYIPSLDDIPASSLGHDSTRNILPWSNDPLYDTPVDSSVKEERIRMLEREFGAQGKSSRSDEGDLDENGNPRVGSVDKDGNLVTQSPIKRIAIRVLQVILTLTAGVPSIYAALVIKPKGIPPPSGGASAIVLYILSIITLISLLYLFVFRRCCGAGKRRKSALNNPLGNGMMVLPVNAMPGGKEHGKKAKKKGKRGGRGQSSVQVNLIVDPQMFQGHKDVESEWNESMPDTYDGAPGRKNQTARRSVFDGLAMEEDWKQARSWAKKLSLVDATGFTLWGAAFVLILIGKRCPSGSFQGWCNAYNVSSAAACLLCIAFGVSIFFDVQDLHASKVSPRTRA